MWYEYILIINCGKDYDNYDDVIYEVNEFTSLKDAEDEALSMIETFGTNPDDIEIYKVEKRFKLRGNKTNYIIEEVKHA